MIQPPKSWEMGPGRARSGPRKHPVTWLNATKFLGSMRGPHPQAKIMAGLAIYDMFFPPKKGKVRFDQMITDF